MESDRSKDNAVENEFVEERSPKHPRGEEADGVERLDMSVGGEGAGEAHKPPEPKEDVLPGCCEDTVDLITRDTSGGIPKPEAVPDECSGLGGVELISDGMEKLDEPETEVTSDKEQKEEVDAVHGLGRIDEDQALTSEVPPHGPELTPSQAKEISREFSAVRFGMADASVDFDEQGIDFGMPPVSGEMGEHMACLAAYTPQMDMLRLSHCSTVNDQVLKVLQPLTSLTFLDLSRCDYVTDEGMESFAYFAKLTHLDLNRTMGISDDGLVHLQSLTEITYLDLGRRSTKGKPEYGSSKRKRVSDLGLAQLIPLQKLQWLGLGHCQISNSGLNILPSFPVLEQIDLGGCPITDSGLDSLNNISSLKFLSLRRCEGVRDDGLLALGEMTDLLSLDLGGCSLLTDEGLPYLRGLQNLETLDLTACNKIASSGLVQVGYLYSLQHLNLSGMSELLGYGLDALSQLSLLWWLNLSGNRDLTDDGAKSLKHLSQLKVLGLAGCVKLTLDGLMGFLPELKKLKFVDFNKLPRVSRSKLVPLKKQYTFVTLQDV